MSNLAPPGTQFWYTSDLHTKIVVLYLGKIPRRKHHMLLFCKHSDLRSLVWLTDGQLTAQLTKVMPSDDPDRLSDAFVQVALAAFRQSKSIKALVDNLRALSCPGTSEQGKKGEQQTHDN